MANTATPELKIDWSSLDIVEQNPNKMGGQPTVRGRRITPDAFVENYNAEPTATPDMVADLFGEPSHDVWTVLRYAEKKGGLKRPLPKL